MTRKCKGLSLQPFSVESYKESLQQETFRFTLCKTYQQTSPSTIATFVLYLSVWCLCVCVSVCLCFLVCVCVLQGSYSSHRRLAAWSVFSEAVSISRRPYSGVYMKKKISNQESKSKKKDMRITGQPTSKCMIPDLKKVNSRHQVSDCVVVRKKKNHVYRLWRRPDLGHMLHFPSPS